jgi:hypothetical protein
MTISISISILISISIYYKNLTNIVCIEHWGYGTKDSEMSDNEDHNVSRRGDAIGNIRIVCLILLIDPGGAIKQISITTAPGSPDNAPINDHGPYMWDDSNQMETCKCHKLIISISILILSKQSKLTLIAFIVHVDHMPDTPHCAAVEKLFEATPMVHSGTFSVPEEEPSSKSTPMGKPLESRTDALGRTSKYKHLLVVEIKTYNYRKCKRKKTCLWCHQ